MKKRLNRDRAFIPQQCNWLHKLTTFPSCTHNLTKLNPWRATNWTKVTSKSMGLATLDTVKPTTFQHRYVSPWMVWQNSGLLSAAVAGPSDEECISRITRCSQPEKEFAAWPTGEMNSLSSLVWTRPVCKKTHEVEQSITAHEKAFIWIEFVTLEAICECSECSEIVL